MKRKILLILILVVSLFFSCRSVINDLPMDSAQDRAESALIILGNPLGTFPVTNADIPDLLEYSRDPNPAVRHMAVFQLGQLDTASYYRDLLPLLIDDDISVSRNTKDLLLRNEQEAARVFREALSGDNNDLILKLLELLVQLDDSASLEKIIELFLSNQKSVVDKAVSAAAALADINDRILYDSLLRPEPEIRIGIVRTLSRMGDPAILGTLLPYMYDPEVKVRNAVKFAFVDFGEKSVPYLINVLNNPAPETQLSVLGLFEALKSPSSIDPIIELFGNENQRVRERAVYTVSTFGETALDNLGRALESDRKEILISAIGLLGKIDNGRSLDFLMTLLDNPDRAVRSAAIKNILLFGTEAGDRFLGILDRRDYDKYSFAVQGLTTLKDPRLISDTSTSLYNRNNRSRALILYTDRDSIDTYLSGLELSGLLKRDISSIKLISLASISLKKAEKEIRDSGSRYTTFYISRNDFQKKSEEALQLSFTYMHNYMDSKNVEDLEKARRQRDYSELFARSAQELDMQLSNYIGTSETEKQLINSFEESRDRIISLYESVSINRKNLADQILEEYGLTYNLVVEGTFSQAVP
ncbi:HEAT repeat domain-containing protein [Spirochaeta isovalerica]|uniref:HEAT repeat protein n=1 Tax=Spirochaeta isovalerica TaxID=150 RepID=A0A841RIS6_9SPIO|nr:HEAT repeat domain-containing protein [Spirochaeta isovalerica]MBB6482629.1 HEAT repeat protein [Spirochaeta isovalerica]